MKVLIIQENGRHEENRHFRECFCMQRSLQRLGHQVDVWGLGHENYARIPTWEDYDLIINLENYDTLGWVPNLDFTDKPKKLLWSIDAHCRGLKSYHDTFKSGKYDLILQATEDFVEDKSVWFPNCYDDTLIYPAAAKKVFIGFCGSMLNRKGLLDFLTQKYDLRQDIMVLGQSMVEAVSSYRIHFNLNLANDINYRSFETLGCGTMLLTNYNPQYEKLGFKDGINCMMYKNVEELCAKIELCLLNSTMVETVSKAGLELAKEHTYSKRAEKLISIYYDELNQ